MKASQYAIAQPRLVLTCTVLVLLAAVWATLSIPVQLAPAITKAIILVAIPYPDSQPTEAETEIARKVEEALTELQGVDFIASTSMRGSSITQVVFLDGVDPDDARREVKDLVDRIRNELPAGREVQPVVSEIDFENMPLMLVSITAPEGFDERALKQIAEDIEEELQTVDGVANTQLYGGKEREIHINVHPDRMIQYGITLTQMRDALAGFHAEIPVGAFNTGTFDRQLRVESKFRNLEDIRQAIVSSDEGRPIRVADVADVEDSFRRVRNLAQLNGRNSATIVVNKEAGINTLRAALQVKEKVEELRQRFPTLDFYTSRDSSQEIWVMFRVLGSSALFGALLVLVILAWSMGLRVSVLVIIAIPFSMAVAMVVLYFSGIPISNMVIFSFILVLGLVVDGAIIVAENIHRHIERGEDPMEAASLGIAEVGVPVIAADLTTIAAYLPMLLVPGIMGDFMGVMPKVVAVALAGSILVDHFVIPTLAARWYKRRQAKLDDSQSFESLTGSRHDLASVRIRSGAGFFTRAYARSLGWILAGAVPFFVILWCVLGVMGAGQLMNHIGFNFFPAGDRGQFIVKYELPLGYSIEESLAASRVITRHLEPWEKTGILVNYVTSVGSASGLSTRVDEDPAAGPEFGQVQVQLVPPMDRSIHQTEVMNYLRRNIEPLPGMKVTIEEVKDGPPGGAPVSVRLTGDNLEQLGDLSRRIATKLKKVPGTLDVTSDYRDDAPGLVIEPKPELLGLANLTKTQLARAVQTAIAGDTSIEITLDDEDIELRLQLAPEYQRHPKELERLLLTSPAGAKTPIGSLADIHRHTELFSVNRYQRNRAVVTRSNVDDSRQPADVFAVLATDILPDLGFEPARGAEKTVEGYSKVYIGREASPAEGIQAEFAGENDERDENFGYMLQSMIIAVVLIAAILVVQFNSFRQSLVVMLTVPLSFIGVIIGMWATGFPFSLATFIGLVSLTGVVVNDAIVLVEFANQARSRGLPLREALIESGVNRLRPVMLTTLTTIGGLLPLMLNVSGGAEFWQPLTGAIVFGLSFATLLTLVVVPSAYYLAYKIPTWIQVALPTLLVTAGVATAGRSMAGFPATEIASALLASGLLFAAWLAYRSWQRGESLVWVDA